MNFVVESSSVLKFDKSSVSTMKSSGIFGTAVFLLIWASANAQFFPLNCEFVSIYGDYTCQLTDVEVPDNANLTFVIGGVHLQGRSNRNVREVIISNSSIPFIISEIFTTFPNLLILTINNGGLTRIQENAFANARNVYIMTIMFNRNLRRIEANAFAGLPLIQAFQLNSNGIDFIHESAFSGLQLGSISMRDNQIQTLPANLFVGLPWLSIVEFQSNLITYLDGKLFADNPLMIIMNFSQNKINAIGRTIFDGITNLQQVRMVDNKCVNNWWIVGSEGSVETVRADLEDCFNNYRG
jgi:Leucine-rich repeat (LRR) protein